MRLDCRDNNCDILYWEGYDKDTGESLKGDYIIAAGDSTGQIVRYEKDKNGNILQGRPLVSEIRNIELVYTKWYK